jgi:hypothetical protein
MQYVFCAYQVYHIFSNHASICPSFEICCICHIKVYGFMLVFSGITLM